MPIRKAALLGKLPKSDMRRKKPFKLVLTTFLALFGLVLIPIVLKPLFVLVLSGGVVALFLLVVRSNRTNRARKSAWEKASRIISTNLDHLTQRRARLVRQDAHAKPLFDKWAKEIEYFINCHISPALAPREHRHLSSQRQQLVGLINQLTYLHMQQEPEKAA